MLNDHPESPSSRDASEQTTPPTTTIELKNESKKITAVAGVLTSQF